VRVFWSWQSDREGKTHRFFVRDVLKLVANSLSATLNLEDAPRDGESLIHVDHDTAGVDGSPLIADTIREKILACDLFVADMTPVAHTKANKAVPNPNVMLELGLALECKPFTNIMLVANSAYYSGLEDVPFDLRNRRGAITYKLSDEATNAEMKTEINKLERVLKPIIRRRFDAFQADQADQIAKKTPVFDDLTRWFENGTVEGIGGVGGKLPKTLQVADGPYAFARLIPTRWPDNANVMSPNPDRCGSLFTGTFRSADWLRIEDGYVTYETSGSSDRPLVITRSDARSGEIWLVAPALVDKDWVYGNKALNTIYSLLEKAQIIYDRLGAQGPYRLKAGFSGIKNLNGAFFSRPSSGYLALKDDVVAEAKLKNLSNDEIRSAIVSIFNSFVPHFGIERQVTLELLHNALGRH
jgi:hypothetical protein